MFCKDLLVKTSVQSSNMLNLKANSHNVQTTDRRLKSRGT